MNLLSSIYLLIKWSLWTILLFHQQESGRQALHKVQMYTFAGLLP